MKCMFKSHLGNCPTAGLIDMYYVVNEAIKEWRYNTFALANGN